MQVACPALQTRSMHWEAASKLHARRSRDATRDRLAEVRKHGRDPSAPTGSPARAENRDPARFKAWRSALHGAGAAKRARRSARRKDHADRLALGEDLC